MAGFSVIYNVGFKIRFVSVDSDDQVSLNIPLRCIFKASYSRHASCTNVRAHAAKCRNAAYGFRGQRQTKHKPRTGPSRWTASAPRESNSLVTPISSLLSALNNFVSISSALSLNLQFELLSAQGVSSGGTRSNKVYKTWLGHSVNLWL